MFHRNEVMHTLAIYICHNITHILRDGRRIYCILIDVSISHDLKGGIDMTAKKYSRIMIATDGSENSTKAIASGMGLAEQLGSTVYAVFVVPTNMASSMPVGSRMTRWEVPYDIMKEEGVKATSYVQEIGNSTGVDVKPILLEGHPSDELIKFANDNAIDMIVVGTLGRTGIERFLLGSVAENVVRHSNVEVLVVR